MSHQNSPSTSNPQPKTPDRHADFETLAAEAAARGDWKSATGYYAQSVEQHAAELALINSVQEGLSSRLEMQAIYDLVGDRLRDTFNAQVVMISQYDAYTQKIFHHYAIERGQHLQIPGWHAIDSSRNEIVRTGKPFMINLDEIIRLLEAEKMHIIPGTELPRTWLGVPMLVRGAVIGIVSLQNLDKENAFSPSDIDLLTALTNSMSASLENARLFNETQRLLGQTDQEMQIARQTQRSILPPHLPTHPGYDYGALFVPARAVGGDFYDFIEFENQKLGIVIGDASDKGLPAALFMAMTFSLVRAEASRFHNQRQILRNVNRYLTHMTADSMFVTLLYAVLDLKTGWLAYSRAGHPPPVLLDADGSVMETRMGLGQPLGLFEDVQIDEQHCLLPPGGLILMHSDGLTEAVDLHGQDFGLQRARGELVAQRSSSAQAICERLWQAVQTHSGENVNQDDFTTLVVKRSVGGQD
jgi:serine phosphatase RsbU (regulator of sigma subunit)